MHLFNKENIWLNPCNFLHTSSHPEKYNNSANRIISKEEERRYPKRDSSIFEYIHPTRTTSVSTRNPVIPCKETILHIELILQEISKIYYSYKAHPVQIDRRHPPATAPLVSKHSTWQNKAPRPLQHIQH